MTAHSERVADARSAQGDLRGFGPIGEWSGFTATDIRSNALRSHGLVRRRIARREGFLRGFVDEGVLVSAKDFLFGLEPVVEFQARLPASPEVEFVGPSPDL